jgi:hypothetical protein
MPSKIERNVDVKAETKSNHHQAEQISAKRRPAGEEIRSRAYEIYLERCDLPGSELDDWLQAERELESAARFLDAAPGERSED